MEEKQENNLIRTDIGDTDAAEEKIQNTENSASAQDPNITINGKGSGNFSAPVQNKGSVWRDIFPLALGEATVSLLVVAVYLIVQACLPEQEIFSYRVITGVLLGSLVILVNYAALSISLGRAVNRFLEMRGTAEMSEEQAAEFAGKHALKIQSTVTVSYIIRTASTIGALVLALFLPVFDVIATVIPLIMFKPILYVTELINRKTGKLK